MFSTARIITIIILASLAIICFIICYRQAIKKGKPFNNAYLYASESQREQMDTAPLFKQSSVIFFLVGIVFLLLCADAVFNTRWLIFVTLGVGALTIIYAIVSTKKINKK